MDRLIDFLPLKIPWAIAVDPSNICNFHCDYCPTGRKDLARQRPNGMMPLHLFKKIVDDVEKMGGQLRALKLWKDGEPLLNENLPEFVRYAQKKKIARQVRLTTNGALLDRMAKSLIDTELDWIMISYLSPREEVYLRYAGKKEMRDRVIANVQLLRKLRDSKKVEKPFIAVNMCKFPYISGEDMEEFKIQFQNIADEIVVHEEPMNWDGSHGTDLRLGAVQEKVTQKKVCPYAWYELNINFNGEVSICPVDWSFKTVIGDVNNETLFDIWTGRRMKAFRNMFAKQELYRNPACYNCTYYHYSEDNIDDFVLS